MSIRQFSYQQCGPINLEITTGDCVGVSGESGAGKTLLLRAIADLDPHGGSVLLDRVEASVMTAPDWRRRVALLPADSRWWFDTVGPHFSGQRCQNLPALGFGDEVLNWSVARLSSGEKQRLSLLRLLHGEPQVLLLDEPTANLDADNTHLVERLIAHYLTENPACAIWVGHDSAQLQRVSNRQYLLKNGLLEAAPC